MPAGVKLSKSELEKIVLVTIGVVVFMFVLIQFVTFPSIRRSAELSNEIIKARESLKKSRALIANKPQMENNFTALQQKLKDYESALPPYSYMPNILQEIADMAAESKVKVIKIEPLKVEKRAEAPKPEKKPVAVKGQTKQEPAKESLPIYSELPIQVEARGAYHAIGGFLNKIESAKNIMSLADVEIDANPEDMFNHNARLSIVVYVSREEMPDK